MMKKMDGHLDVSPSWYIIQSIRYLLSIYEFSGMVQNQAITDTRNITMATMNPPPVDNPQLQQQLSGVYCFWQKTSRLAYQNISKVKQIVP
jgi:hypothetical protein